MVYVERFSTGSLHGSQTDVRRVCLQGELSGWLARQRQAEFISCPMLYAIAMGHIIKRTLKGLEEQNMGFTFEDRTAGHYHVN